MTVDELKDLFRSEMDDVEEPFLWSDLDVYRYIDDAQKMFCRLTEGIADATTPSITELAVGASTTWIDTDPAILRIRTARRSDNGRSVEILNYEDMAQRGWRFDGTQGCVRALIIGMEADKARVYPDSNETVTINLTVFRLTLDCIDEDSGDDDLEIATQHQMHLLKWVKSLAYAKQDSETYDKKKKAEFEAEFRSYCDQAKNEQGRARAKVRTVAYGGI